MNTAPDLDPQPWFKWPCIKGLFHEFFFGFGLLGKLQAKIRTTGDLVYLNNFFSTDIGVSTLKKYIFLNLLIFFSATKDKLFVAYDLLEGINNKWFSNVAPMFKSHAVRDRST